MPRAIEQARKVGPVAVPLDLLPLMVTINNPAEGTSARRVDPTDLSEIFGIGYHLSKVTVEVSDDIISRNLGKYLPFVDQLPHTTGVWGGDFHYEGNFELATVFYRRQK